MIPNRAYYGQLIIKWASGNRFNIPAGITNFFATPRGATFAYNPARSQASLLNDQSAAWTGILSIENLGGWRYRIFAENFSIIYFFEGRIPTVHNFYPRFPDPDCPANSCRVNCVGAPNGFCCVANSLSDRLLQILQN